MLLQSIHPNPPNAFLKLSHHPLLKPSLSPSLTFLHKPTSLHSLRTSSEPLPPLAEAEPPISAVPTTPTPPENGPIELSPDMPSIFATDDDPSFIQVSTSVLLTGAISVFLFRSLRRRAKRAKELRMRSTGAKKTLKEEALESLKAMSTVSLEPKKSEPSPVQTLLGGLTAGVIALILYKFTLTIEAALNRQTLSDSFSVRQITVTIRTIITGLCYLATFVFGTNALGLFLYSGQLALNSLSDGSTNSDTTPRDEKESSSPNQSSESSSTGETSDTDQTS